MTIKIIISSNTLPLLAHIVHRPQNWPLRVCNRCCLFFPSVSSKEIIFTNAQPHHCEISIVCNSLFPPLNEPHTHKTKLPNGSAYIEYKCAHQCGTIKQFTFLCFVGNHITFAGLSSTVLAPLLSTLSLSLYRAPRESRALYGVRATIADKTCK